HGGFHGISAWLAEILRHAGRARGTEGRAGFHAWGGGRARNIRRRPHHSRIVHDARCLYSVGRNGRRIFPYTRSAGILADPERRGAGGVLLLLFPLAELAWGRSVESGPAVRPQNIDSDVARCLDFRRPIAYKITDVLVGLSLILGLN